MHILVLLILPLLLLSGCTFFGNKSEKADRRVEVAETKLAQESQALTTAALEAVSIAPVNPPTELAKRFLKRDQEIEGLPPTHLRYDVTGILSGTNAAASAMIDSRFADTAKILMERDIALAEKNEINAKLIEMGKLYEAEKNRSILKRIWRWTFSTLGVAGLVAACVLFPPVMSVVLCILGRLLAFATSAFPKLVGFVGVVGKGTLDRTVAGIERFKQSQAGNAEVIGVFEEAVSRKMDTADKLIVKSRKPVAMSRYA